eukprot:12406342-Ditylum_brightwellii.AAC.1
MIETDLTGSGCLYPVPRAANAKYVEKDTSSTNLDIGKAVKVWVFKEESKKIAQFMCPALS